ncbi:MAG: group 1 glycosyl transferase [Parcubacteria group bacterium]|nr:group 1 glycosyl transferase [Parcubacteria group bacterium]
MKKIGFFGIYDREYSRNKVIIRGLEENGYSIVHAHIDPKVHKGLKKYWLLAKEAQKFRGEDLEFIFVAFPGHTCVWLAKLLFPRKRIVFDIFISQYASNVVDRKVHKPYSLKAYKDYFLDWYSIRAADVVVIDANEHIKAFGRNYGLKKEKAIRIFLSSALTPVEHPKDTSGREEFIVHYHGTFIGVHGVEHIIRAAKMVEGNPRIVFKMIGGGQLQKEMKTLAESLGLRNMEFFGRIPDYQDVLKRIDDCDVLLGAFGTTERGHWVIMNKIFEGMVFGKAMVSADTPGMRELFTDRENVSMCKAGDPSDLAEKILELEKDEALKKKIGQAALDLFKAKLSPKMLVQEFLIDLYKII